MFFLYLIYIYIIFGISNKFHFLSKTICCKKKRTEIRSFLRCVFLAISISMLFDSKIVASGSDIRYRKTLLNTKVRSSLYLRSVGRSILHTSKDSDTLLKENSIQRGLKNHHYNYCYANAGYRRLRYCPQALIYILFVKQILRNLIVGNSVSCVFL